MGQNPGAEEIRQGRPFVGRSGRYLDEVLAKNHIDRSKLFITNVVKVATPANRPPRADEIREWLPYLLEEIRQIKPEIVVLMGNVAWKIPRFKGIRYIETCHPTAAMRFPRAQERFEKDFKKLGELMKEQNDARP